MDRYIGTPGAERVLVLAGTNTYGVQAAADFTIREDLISDLLARIGATGKRPVPDFEALLEVKVNGGVPVQSKLIILRQRSSTIPATSKTQAR